MTSTFWRRATIAVAFVGAACQGGDTPASDRRPLTPGEGFADVPGGRVWYRVAGNGPGTPLVVLHGGPGASSHYLESLAQLGSERPVIFYDQLGSGRSDRTADTTLWRIERFMAELDSVRSHLGLTDIHLLGHSWGSMLATDYVLAGATGVRSLVLASPALSAARWEADADTLISTLPPDLQRAIARSEAAGSYADSGYQAAVKAYYDRFLTLRGGPMLDTTMAQMNVALYEYMWGPSEFTATGTLKSYDRTGRLGELRLPVLYTTGEYDEARRSTVQYYQSLTPGAQFELIRGSGHLTSLDAPEDFANAVGRFLKSIEAAN